MTAPEHPGRVEVWKGRTGWAWWCQVHRCTAEPYRRYGNKSLFELAVHEADAHAREFHHPPISHDRT